MYSAYMLFYERVAPQKTQKTTTDISSIIPRSIFQKIWEDNMTFLHEKNIFDPDYYKFLWGIVSLDKSPGIQDYNAVVTQYDPLMKSIQLATRFIIVTLTHGKEKTALRDYTEYLKTLYSKHIPACKWFIEHVLTDPTWLQQILLQCSVPETREILSRLFIHIISCVAPFERQFYLEEEPIADEMEIEQKSSRKPKQQESDNPLTPKLSGTPKSLVVKFMDYLFSLLKEAPNHWHNFAQLFLIMRDFASLGTEEKKYLAARGAVAQLVDFYLAEDSPFVKNTQQKRKKMGDKFSNPNISHLVDFISIMARSSSTNSPQTPPTQFPEPLITLSSADKELLYYDAFYARIMKENQNSKATVEIATHLCWEDETTSKKFLDVCTRGINLVDHDGFKPYLDVFTALLALADSLQAIRVDYGLESLLRVIEANLKYRNATFHSVKYLMELSGKNLLVREWLFKSKEKWMEHYFLANASEAIRDMAAMLIQSLAPEYPALPADGPAPPAEFLVPISKDTMDRVHDIYRHLLSLLKTARTWWRTEVEPGKTTADYEIGWWRLVGYFRLLKWYSKGPEEKAIFAEYFADFTNLLTLADSWRLPCDENKREMVNLWLHCLKDNSDNLKLLIENEKVALRLLDFFISISPETRYRTYNQAALPPFYTILHMLCVNSPKYLEKLMFHQNFAWALKFLYLETPEYVHTSTVVYEILKLCCNASPTFRVKHIRVVLQGEKIHVASINVLK